MPTGPPKVAFTGSLKQRATRRGLRSLNGKFYHTIQERNAADRAFNKALKDLPGDLAREREAAAAKGEKPFDFTYKQEVIKKPPAEKIVTPHYYCTVCRVEVERGVAACPGCGSRFVWEGL